MQYKEELVAAANYMYNENEDRKIKLINQIQLHAVNQIKNGYTSFRISKLSKNEEKYLSEWANATNARIDTIKFKYFEDSKRYVIKQFMVDFKDSMNFNYELEGKTLIVE